jgi:hypothetical protein
MSTPKPEHISNAPRRSPGAFLGLLAVLGVAAVLLLRSLFDTSLGYPDADRILMDGVFIRDFLSELPLTRVYDYTIQYFGQYPALSIGYRPPFFPFLEGLYNLVFGVNMWSSRLALFTFVVVGVSSWYLLINRAFDTLTAFLASLLLVTTPFLVQWGWYTMGEWPVLAMVLLTGYLFYRYSETDTPRYLYGAALALALAMWTKQTAGFALVWILLYTAFSGKLLSYLKRREVWLALLLLVVLVTPLAIVTAWLGAQNIGQSIGTEEFLKNVSRLSWKNFSHHLGTLFQQHLPLPTLILAGVGLAWAIARRDRRVLFFLALILATYAVFTYIVGKNARYPLFWIPAFTALAALPVHYAARHSRTAVALAGIFVAGISGYQSFLAWQRSPSYATGFDEAARYVLANSESPTVFFDGYNNGYFTYFTRALDPGRSMYVLRGDKLLSSSSIVAKHWLEVHAQTDKDIRKILDDYGVQYVVVESKDVGGVEIHQRLREFLVKGPFRLAANIPVSTNRPPLKGQNLLIYEYLERKGMAAETIKLRLPVVGQTVTVPMRALPERRPGTPEQE